MVLVKSKVQPAKQGRKEVLKSHGSFWTRPWVPFIHPRLV